MAEQHSNLSPRLEGHQREQPKYNLKVLKAEFCTVRDTAYHIVYTVESQSSICFLSPKEKIKKLIALGNNLEWIVM